MSHPNLVTCNASNEDKLTLLHKVCATGNQAIIRDLLSSGTNVNHQSHADFQWCNFFIPKGSTALHIAVMNGNCDMVMHLWDEGADPNIKDANGMTPLHWLLMVNNPSKSIAEFFFAPPIPLEQPEPVLPAPPMPVKKKRKKKKKNKNNSIPYSVPAPVVPNKPKRPPNIEVLKESVANNGLTHLHVASFFGFVTAVEKLIKGGSNVDAVVSRGSVDYADKLPGLVSRAGLTPLNLAMKNQHHEVVNLLIRNGANVLLKRPNGLNPLLDTLLNQPKYYANAFVWSVRGSRELQNLMYDSYGLTMLHLNSYVVDVSAVECWLNRNDDINRIVRLDSPLWPGFTPLHVLIRYYEAYSGPANDLLQLLLDRGADVTKSNANGCTPLHLAFYLDIDAKEKVRLMHLLMKNHKVFKLNPTDKKELSHFHIACALVDIGAMKEFLKRGVDVNRSVGHCHDSKLAGCNALHLVLNQSLNQGVNTLIKREAVDVLIEHGAHVNAENSHGNTPLHSVVKCDPLYMDLMKKLLDAGARIYARNAMDQTAFEVLLNSLNVSAQEIEFFLGCGYKLNDFNRITHKGYLAIIFSKYINVDMKKLILETVVNASCVGELDPMGRNAIHNIISTSRQTIPDAEYAVIIEKLLKVGCDINHQANSGKTALHIATQFRNCRGIVALLNAGADINVIDAANKTAFSYAIESSSLVKGYQNRKEILQIFANHLQKLNLCLLYVNETNQKVLAEVLQNYNVDVNLSSNFYEELKLAKVLKIEMTSLTLLDFISETNAVAAYPSLPQSQRLAVDKYMESVDTTSLTELIGIIKLQYRKALARLKVE